MQEHVFCCLSFGLRVDKWLYNKSTKFDFAVNNKYK